MPTNSHSHSQHAVTRPHTEHCLLPSITGGVSLLFQLLHARLSARGLSASQPGCSPDAGCCPPHPRPTAHTLLLPACACEAPRGSGWHAECPQGAEKCERAIVACVVPMPHRTHCGGRSCSAGCRPRPTAMCVRGCVGALVRLHASVLRVCECDSV